MLKKILFILSSFMLVVGSAYAKENEPLYLVKVTNRCSVVSDNRIVVPVRVISENKGVLTSLIDEYALGYVDNNRDTMKVKITDIKGIDNVILDSKRDGYGRSLILYSLLEDLEANSLDEIVSFNIQVEFISQVPDTYYVLGNEVIISNEEVCREINGYEVKEIEKIKYVDLSKVDHSEMINDLITKVVIGILVIVIIILGIGLIKRKK